MLEKQKLLETPTLKSKIYFLAPVFIAALIFGFLIELSFFERINLQQLSEKLKETYLLSQSQYESEESVYNMAKQQELLEEDMNKNKVVPLKWKDDNTLLDIDNFSFVINNQSVCKQTEETDKKLLLILVTSERSHFTERKAVRGTYGSLLEIEDYSIRVIFLLGINPPVHISANPFNMDNETLYSLVEKENMVIEEENELISNESLIYGDMVVGSFIENQSLQYSYRHIMGYKWVLNFCPNARYVFKVDDNVFINLYQLIVQNELSFDTDFICKILYLSSADCILCLDTFNLDEYPKFCSGQFYGVNVDWIYKIYSVSQRYTLLADDDAFITGILREKAEKSFNSTAKISENPKILFRKDERVNLCSNNSTNRTAQIEKVSYVQTVQRDENLTENFMCLWNTTINTATEL